MDTLKRNIYDAENFVLLNFAQKLKRYGIKKFLNYGSKIKIIEKLGQFSRFKNYWIKNSNIKTIDFKSKDIFIAIFVFNSSHKIKNIEFSLRFSRSVVDQVYAL